MIKKELKIVAAIQVTKTLIDPDVKKREFSGLLEAMKAHHLTEGTILTLDEEGEEVVHEEDLKMHIKIIPIWKWLLS